MSGHPGSFDLEAELRSTRAICHVDLDAFYAQVEEKAHPCLHGMPIAVIQYNPFGDLKTYRENEDRVFNDSNGSIIALSYGEARRRGVTRNMRGTEARQLCPNLQLVQVPTSNGKADLTSYRRNGAAVLAILSEPDGDLEVTCEKASIDESYMDVTDAAKERLRRQKQPWASALPDALDQVHVGCQIVAEKRAKVQAALGFTLSAGVAHSKLLAKLCSGLNKPNQQTVLPCSSVAELLHDMPLSKLRGLGGQLGEKVQSDLSVATIGELAQVPMQRLHTVFGEDTGRWLYDMCRGVDRDMVQPRLAPKSVGCGKSFTAHLQIKNLAKAQYWLQNLAQEIHERLEEDAVEHARRATRLVLHTSSPSGQKSKGAPLASHSADAISRAACQLMSSRSAGDPSTFPLTGLSLVASAFDSSAANTANLRTIFAVRKQGGGSMPAILNTSGDAVGLASNAECHPLESRCAQDGACLYTFSEIHIQKDSRAAPASEDKKGTGGAVSTGAVGPDQDTANAGLHQESLVNSSHKPSASNEKQRNSHAGSDRMIPSTEPVCAQCPHDLMSETAAAMEVDSLTLAQMPSEIRSELYLMSSSASAKNMLQQPKKRTRSPLQSNHPASDRKMRGIETFFNALGGKGS